MAKSPLITLSVRNEGGPANALVLTFALRRGGLHLAKVDPPPHAGHALLSGNRALAVVWPKPIGPGESAAIHVHAPGAPLRQVRAEWATLPKPTPKEAQKLLANATTPYSAIDGWRTEQALAGDPALK